MSDIIKIDVKADEVKVIPIGDVHYGYKTCNVTKFKSLIQYVKDSPNCYVLGIGDLMEVSNKNSPGTSMYDQIVDPDTQFVHMVEMLTPIKEKIIGLLSGNHEARMRREAGFKLTRELAERLETPYLGFSAFVNVKVNSFNYDIYAVHGDSKSSEPPGKLTSVLKLGRKADADIYLMGHVHDIITYKGGVIAADRDRMIATIRKRYYATTGHFLDYEDSYADEKGYLPTLPGVIKIKFFGDRWDAHISS